MAIIGKIREKSWLILVIIGGALIAFILGDYNKGAGSIDYQYGYGTVYGEMFDMDAFNREVKIAQDNADLQSDQQADQQGQPRPPHQPVDKAVVWKQFVEKLILEKEFAALGIEVSPAEFDAYLYGKSGFEVLPEIKSQFLDSLTGEFNEKLLQSTIEQMETSEDPNEVQRWETNKEYFTNRRRQEKYLDVLSQGLYVTKLEAKNDYVAQKEVKSISFIFKRYAEIKDEDVPVTDEKLKAYFEKHKGEKKYQNKVSAREVKFFDITIDPSKQDSIDFNKEMNDLKARFAETKNDSTFVLANSDFKAYSSTHMLTFRPETDEKARQGVTYPVFMDSVFAKASVGDLVGPYEDNGNMRVAKILDFNENLLTARHILIAAQKGDDAAVAKAKRKTDSILPLLTSDNFEEYVTNFSDDPGSKETGGKYEDFMDYEMVPEFSKYATDEPIGKIGYVQTDYGFHIMEVLERKPVRFPVLAVIQKTLKASTTTVEDKEMEVDNLIYKLNDELALKESGEARVVLFDTIVSQAGHFSRATTIEENNPVVYGFKSQITEDKILELAFSEGAKVGDLIGSPIKEGNRYIVAILSSIKEKGETNFEDVKPAIEGDYIRDYKAKSLKAELVKGKSLNDLETKFGLKKQKADVTFANPQITGAGFEPEVVGAVFSGLADGERSLPIQGNTGVFVVQIEKTTKAPAAANYDVERAALEKGLVDNIQTSAVTGLTKLADVIDNRRFFDYNIRR